MIVKRCSACKQEKPTSEFGKRAPLKDGLRSRCLQCERAAARKTRDKYKNRYNDATRRWRQKNPERVAANNRRWNSENVERRIELNKQYEERYPEKKRAHHALTRDVHRGKISKPKTCERCGTLVAAVDLHGHHHDYSKPLDVEWLCRECHIAEHKKEQVAA